MKRCPECISYNHGAGTRACLKCHKYADILKNSTRRNNVPISVVPQNILEAIEDESSGQITTILKAIRSLPPQLSLIVAGIYICGLTHRQVASLMQIPPGSVVKKNKFSLEIIKKILI